MSKSLCLLVVLMSGAVAIDAQSDGSARFDVVSIKRNTSGEAGNAGRSLPDGTIIWVNTPIRAMLMAGAAIPVIDVVGYPEWAMRERYDITAKPPEGSGRDRSGEMMRNLLIDRMKLSGHVEQREQTTFALVLARKDGKLGPELEPSTIDCRRKPGDPAPNGPPANPDYRNGCFTSMGMAGIQSGSMNMPGLASALRMGAGGLVTDRTGIEGFYKVNLKFRSAGQPASATPAVDDLPDVFTAVQEQLGLKLVPEKTMQPIFVVDHLERPTEN